MTILTILGTSFISLALIIGFEKVTATQEKQLLKFVIYILLAFTLVIMASELSGSKWHPNIQISVIIYVAFFLSWRILNSNFWKLVFFQACFVLLLVIGGYLYMASQTPYAEEPFHHISSNQPHELKPVNFPHHFITGLPVLKKTVIKNFSYPTHTAVSKSIKQAENVKKHSQHNQLLSWETLAPLMQNDSQIRKVLHNLKEKQDRELSDMLAQLNAVSVSSTQMRRRALSLSQVENLLKERAISTSRHRTLKETWRLLDSDERAFRNRQAEERFHTLLELLHDENIDESNKIDFINFMVKHFSNDIRLLKPLIKLYDRLDHSYPRQKRLNKAFLDLYVARCEAILNGFTQIGSAAIQPLLDYRKQTISEITYSQARLDKFIFKEFGNQVSSLYQTETAISVPDFLNRRKYPIAEKLSGPSFKQDYIRRILLKTMYKNVSMKYGQPVMGMPDSQYQSIKKVFATAGYDNQIDYLVINSEPQVRGNLAWYLAEKKDPYLIPLLFELMRDSNPDVRRIAAIAIGNFKIVDTQGANDPKFIEIVKMLQNYRSNSDAFGRAWGLLSLSNNADKQKTLYLIDLILNDGSGYHSSMGTMAPTWRSKEEQHVIDSLVNALEKTPEELLVKTYALNTLIAINSPESLGILLQYLHHIYETHHTRPSMWRYFIPHLTLPQEAENVEDVIVYLAKATQSDQHYTHTRHLKALNEYIRKAYQTNRSGEYFQLLRFLKVFDENEYADYLNNNIEQIRIMRIYEYFHASYIFWLIFWPVTLSIVLFMTYIFLPFIRLSGPKRAHSPNLKANPASDTRQQIVAPAPTIVPIKIIKQNQ